MTQELTAEASDNRLTKLWKRFVVKPVKNQITRGASIEKTALTMAISPMVCAFPILGTTNLLSLIIGTILRLNLPFFLLFKTIFYPLHIGLILVFIRIGETMNGAPHIPFSIPQLLVKFKNDPLQFAKDFGMTALYGVEAWAIITPWFAIPLYFIFHKMLTKYSNRKSNKSAA